MADIQDSPPVGGENKKGDKSLYIINTIGAKKLEAEVRAQIKASKEVTDEEIEKNKIK